MNAGAVVMGSQNRIVRRFTEAGATDAAHAVTPADVGCRDTIVLQGLVRRGVVVEVSPGRFYVDPAQAAALRSRRRTVLLTLFGAVVVVLLYLWSRSR